MACGTVFHSARSRVGKLRPTGCMKAAEHFMQPAYTQCTLLVFFCADRPSLIYRKLLFAETFRSFFAETFWSQLY